METKLQATSTARPSRPQLWKSLSILRQMKGIYFKYYIIYIFFFYEELRVDFLSSVFPFLLGTWKLIGEWTSNQAGIERKHRRAEIAPFYLSIVEFGLIKGVNGSQGLLKTMLESSKYITKNLNCVNVLPHNNVFCAQIALIITAFQALLSKRPALCFSLHFSPAVYSSSPAYLMFLFCMFSLSSFSPRPPSPFP